MISVSNLEQNAQMPTPSQEQNFSAMCEDIAKFFPNVRRITRDHVSIGFIAAMAPLEQDRNKSRLSELDELVETRINSIFLIEAVALFELASNLFWIETFTKDMQVRTNINACFCYALTHSLDLKICLHTSQVERIIMLKNEIENIMLIDDENRILIVAGIFCRLISRNKDFFLVMLAANWFVDCGESLRRTYGHRFEAA